MKACPSCSREVAPWRYAGVIAFIALGAWIYYKQNQSIPRLLNGSVEGLETNKTILLWNVSASSVENIFANTSMENNEFENGVTETSKESGSAPESLPSACLGKEKLLDILQMAEGGDFLLRSSQETAKLCRSLPRWSKIVSLYGSSPVLLGQEACSSRHELKTNDLAEKQILAVAGLYNSGTNHLAKLLRVNFDEIHGLDVPWGKHERVNSSSHLEQRYSHNSSSQRLPIVVVKHPYSWMHSMCRSPYDARWKGWQKEKRCPPRLVKTTPNQHNINDTEHPWETLVVNQAYSTNQTYPSLADMWSIWMQEYVDLSVGRLIIRFEDLLFHAPTVMNMVSDCVGIPIVEHPVYHFIEKSKNHTKRSRGLLEALMIYGEGLWNVPPMSKTDMDYAKHVGIDSKLMQLFHYSL